MSRIIKPEDPRRKEKLEAFDRLLTIMDELRANCPWDKKQTLESLRHLTIEETYELSTERLDAFDRAVDQEPNDELALEAAPRRIGDHHHRRLAREALNRRLLTAAEQPRTRDDERREHGSLQHDDLRGREDLPAFFTM